MVDHDLCEKTAGLASRVGSLANKQDGSDKTALLEQQDRLAKLALAAIVKDLSAEDKDYQAAIGGLRKATDSVQQADQKIGSVANAISLVAKAAGLVEQALSAAAKAGIAGV